MGARVDRRASSRRTTGTCRGDVAHPARRLGRRRHARHLGQGAHRRLGRRGQRACATPGSRFAVTSGRPPRGMAMLVGPLAIRDPIGGFNGGLVVRPGPDGARAEHSLASSIVPRVIEALDAHGVDVWCYQGNDWLVRDLDAPHVAREAATVEFPPTLRARLRRPGRRRRQARGGERRPRRDRRGAGRVDARRSPAPCAASTSQPYYLDVTHPDANKGGVIAYLVHRPRVSRPRRSPTIGDVPERRLDVRGVRAQHRDGQRERPGVRLGADEVTRSNDEDGFALAMERFVLDA